MKRFLTNGLVLTCLMALFCPAFAAVECQMPQELPVAKVDILVNDVPVLNDRAGEMAPPDVPVQDIPTDGGMPWEPLMTDGKYSHMGALYQAWGGYEGYPDYICGVWSTDGGMTHMTVAVTNDEAGEKGKAEILSLLANPETVTFTTQKYSYQQLLVVNDEIVAQMIAGDSPIVACGVYEMENKVHVTVDSGNKAANDTIAALTAQYGDLILVEAGEGVLIYDTLTTGTPSTPGAVDLTAKPSMGNYFPVILVLILLALAGLTVALRRPAKVTTTGKVVTDGKPTHAQVEAAVSQSTETPPDRVEEQIKKKM